MDDQAELLPATKRLLEQRAKRLSLRKISAGSGVNLHWLGKFVQGKFDDPGVKKIQKLHDYLISLPDDSGEHRVG